MNKLARVLCALAVTGCLTPAFADDINIYYGPKGGFAKVNNSRKLIFSDKSERKATLSNSIIHKFDSLEPGSTAKVAMYSMSDFKCLDAMVNAAIDKGVHIKLLLDGVPDWTKESREQIAGVIKKGAERAEKEGKPYDFVLAATTQEAMKRVGREQTLDDGKKIYGTMHEKFGIFYKPGQVVPTSCFNGSANMSTTSDQIYGENRVFFEDQPVVARQFAEEFARLWNEYSSPVFGKWIPERFIETSYVPGYVKLVFNSEPVSETELTRIDNELINLIGRVKDDGGLDLSMFSFTRRELAEAILRSAARHPKAKFRLLFDHAQLDDDDKTQGKLAPWLIKEAKKRNLKNIEARFRFRRNAYAYDPQTDKVCLVSYMSLFLHHKNVSINNKEIVVGSYNWSGSAENMNFENIMMFNGDFQHHQKIVDSFKAEFDTLWESRMPEISSVKWVRKGVPQTVTLEEGRKLHEKLLKTMKSSKDVQAVHTALGRDAFKTYDELKKETKLNDKKLKAAINTLTKDGFIIKFTKKDVEGYAQAD